MHFIQIYHSFKNIWMYNNMQIVHWFIVLENKLAFLLIFQLFSSYMILTTTEVWIAEYVFGIDCFFFSFLNFFPSHFWSFCKIIFCFKFAFLLHTPALILVLRNARQWRSKEGSRGSTRLGARTLGERINTLYLAI